MSRSCNLHFCDYRIFVMYTDPIEYIEIIFHSQAVPEGYVLSTEEFPVTEDAQKVEIILKKA